jgi:hypothetical protein
LDRHDSEELYTRISMDTGSSEWTQVGLREKSPENAVKASIYINITKGNRGSGGTIWIDEFCFMDPNAPVEASETEKTTEDEKSVMDLDLKKSVVVNPGFEEDSAEGLFGWKVNLGGPGRGEAFADTKKRAEGRRSLKLSVEPGVGETLQLFQTDIPVEPLTEYDIYFLYYVEGLEGSKHRNLVDIYWYDEKGTRLDRHDSEDLYTSIPLDINGAGWTQAGLRETSPENAVKASIYISITKGDRGSGGAIWIDRFYFAPYEKPILPVEISGSLVENPGFEKGLEGWNVSLDGPGRGVITADTEKKKEGESSLKLAAEPFGGGTLQLFQENIPVEPWTDYDISLFYRMENMVVSDDPKMTELNVVDIYWYDAGGNRISRLNGEEIFTRITLDNAATDWEYVSVSEKSPGGAVRATMYIQILKAGRGSGGKLWIDEIAFIPSEGLSKPTREDQEKKEGKTKTEAPADIHFTDVDQDHPYYRSILFVCGEGFMDGTEEGKFSPDLKVTKELALLTLYRMAEGGDGDAPFDSLYNNAATWALKRGVIHSVDEYLFNGDSDITKEQLLSALYNYAEVMKYDLPEELRDVILPFDTEGMPKGAIKAFRWALALKIINDDGEEDLNPKAYVTRAEFANIIERFVRLRNTESDQ